MEAPHEHFTGPDDKHITSIDEDGVPLAIRALHAENDQLRARLVALKDAE